MGYRQATSSGPCRAHLQLVPLADAGDLARARSGAEVNGQARQHGELRDPIWNVAETCTNCRNSMSCAPATRGVHGHASAAFIRCCRGDRFAPARRHRQARGRDRGGRRRSVTPTAQRAPASSTHHSRSAPMGMVSEFKEFIARSGVLDLAVGVVIGAAFGKIVSSLSTASSCRWSASHRRRQRQRLEIRSSAWRSSMPPAKETAAEVAVKYGVPAADRQSPLIIAFVIFLVSGPTNACANRRRGPGRAAGKTCCCRCARSAIR